MKIFLVCIFGSVGMWATESVSVALQILICLVTVIVLLYEKRFFKNRCRDCFYYRHYLHDENRQEEESGND